MRTTRAKKPREDRYEWGVRWADNTYMICTNWAEAHRRAKAAGGTVTRRAVGPWQVAPLDWQTPP